MMGSAGCQPAGGRQLADETIKSSNAIQKVPGKLPSTADKAACAPRIRNSINI